MRLRIAAFAGPALLFAVQLCLAQSGTFLYQQGLVKERLEGNMEGAIQIYQRIVSEFPYDRPLVAKALVQIGRCYLTLGRRAEAETFYAKVIRDYKDQTAWLPRHRHFSRRRR